MRQENRQKATGYGRTQERDGHGKKGGREKPQNQISYEKQNNETFFVS